MALDLNKKLTKRQNATKSALLKAIEGFPVLEDRIFQHFLVTLHSRGITSIDEIYETVATGDELPDAIGGGPPVAVVSTVSARTALARARCASVAACEGAEIDPCVTREEATIAELPCVSIVRERLNACVEATRARTCTDPTTPQECAPEELCSKEQP